MLTTAQREASRTDTTSSSTAPRPGAPGPTIAIIGLGYVGLPLAVEFGKTFRTIGFDLSHEKVEAYRRHTDPTGEVSDEALRAAVRLQVTTDAAELREADFVIVAVPTPVDTAHNPDFSPLVGASESVGRNLKQGATIVYESTVYPGATEEVCVPVIEKFSGKRWKRDFHVGYSPERINPGDKQHTLTRIVKVVSGDSPETLDLVASVYGSVITAGVHRASSIKVAEAAKVIENTQRDLNIALVNELAIIFHELGIDTLEVLQAAGTKWNFLPFRPGLVGGHCIGVDPYYLVEKARQLGMQTHVITAGRVINEGMGNIVAHEVMEAIKTPPADARILVLGLTFKENMPDTRNSKSRDVVLHFTSSGYRVQVHDPYLTTDGIRGQDMEPGSLEDGPYDAVLLLVPHKEYLAIPLETLLSSIKKGGVVYDLKSSLDADAIRAAGYTYQAL